MGNSVEKRTIAQFVHDAVEMETAIFTLDKMIEECKDRQETINIEAKKDLEEAEEDLEEAKNKVPGQTLPSVITAPPRKEEIGCITTGCGGFLLGLAIVFGVVFIAYIVFYVFFKDVEISEIINGVAFALFFYGTIALTVLISFILAIRKRNNKYKKEMKLYKELSQKIKENERRAEGYRLESVIICQDRVRNAKARIIEAEKESQMIDLQINEIKAKRKQLQSDLSVFYNYGIIPPDYRYMDCVIILDQIFRNDLADTMRDAIKIYEERVFRGSVIRGMDKICEKLDELSSDMSAISLRLDMIDSNISRMSDDLSNYNQRLLIESENNRAVTDDLIRETQLGRYTNEKLLESNKRLEYYAEEYRMGRMPIR